MVRCIGQFVDYVEIDNTVRNSVLGRVTFLDGSNVDLDLVGNLPPALRGAAWQFINPHAAPHHEDSLPESVRNLRFQQVGVIGHIALDLPCPSSADPTTTDGSRTASGHDGSPGQSPSATDEFWCYGLQWFGQDGQVVIEGPLVVQRIDVQEDEGDQISWGPAVGLEELLGSRANALHDADAVSGQAASVDQAPEQPRQAEANFFKQLVWYAPDEEAPPSTGGPHATDDTAPADAGESEFEEASEDFTGGEPADEDLNLLHDVAEQLQKFRHVYEEEEEPVPWLIPDPLQLPKPQHVESEEEAELLVRRVLGQLARLNISLHVCSHLANRDIYRMLIEHLIPSATAPARLPETDVILNYDAFDYCPICREEIDLMADAAIDEEDWDDLDNEE
ncbi:MAG: hypothetical protein KatS3mg111_3352 [Pirellulaceae bacterium]|nr:MAG: hypothetical protein KatS3mg111_3352 [Pirellulaceae bacterium]